MNSRQLISQRAFLNSIARNNDDSGNDDGDWVDSYYVPCIRSIGDVNAAAALIAPRPLWVVNTRGVFDTAQMQALYEAAGAATFRVSSKQPTTEAITAALR